MTVAELLEQAKTLSIQELRELVRLLEDSLGTSQPTTESKSGEHWGESLVRLVEELGPIEPVYPEIEDPVDWVKQIRKEQMQKRLGDWGESE